MPRTSIEDGQRQQPVISRAISIRGQLQPPLGPTTRPPLAAVL